MQLTKREEKLLSLLIEVGSLSVAEIGELLFVSKRTVYRVLTQLNDSLMDTPVSLEKIGKKYQLVGDVESLKNNYVLDYYTRNERLYLMTNDLLLVDTPLVNHYFQDKYLVSDVTVRQEIVNIEGRLLEFDVAVNRQQGYILHLEDDQRRRLLAIVTANYLSLYGESSKQFEGLQIDKAEYSIVKTLFEERVNELPFIDHHMQDYLVALLYYGKYFPQNTRKTSAIGKLAMDYSREIYSALGKALKHLYAIDEILYFASVLDDLIIKRQDNPLFTENFDSQFFYSVSNLIDTVALYTKIDFAKDATLFKFLFAHLKLSLAIPLLYPLENTKLSHQLEIEKNDFLYRVVCLVVQDLFPGYIQNNLEYSYITLHFAASIRRSPSIYPVRLLLLSNERPLNVEQLISRIKAMSPFVDSVQISLPSMLKESDFKRYDCILSTSPLVNEPRVEVIPIHPNIREMIRLQEFLHQLLEKRSQQGIGQDLINESQVDNYLEDSQSLLTAFNLIQLVNAPDFTETVRQIVMTIDACDNKQYLADKLVERFKVSPLAIPNTGLALLHTSSSHVTSSVFKIFELQTPVDAVSMNFETEGLKRILVMLTPIDASESVRELMVSISQSIIENHLYTEIYKTGNKDIIYQLLSKLFTDRIKQMES